MGLVDDRHSDLTELVSVFTRVVGAEEQLATTLELNPEVGLGSTPVAAVLRRQGGGGGNCSSHIGLISVLRCLAQRTGRDKDSRLVRR